MQRDLNIDNLLLDETFVRYCLGTATVTEYQYWWAFIKEHPEWQSQIHQAEKIILGMHNWGIQEELNEEEEKLRKLIHTARRKGLTLSLFRKVSIAAVLFALVWGIYLIKQQNEQRTFVTMRTGVGEIRKLSFPDGSFVWLNANTSVKYPKYFQHFRKIVLEEGEIFCQARHNESYPFSVTTATGMTINDIGTSFSVKSYAALHEEQVSVLEGEVEVKAMHLTKGRGVKFEDTAPARAILYQVDPAEVNWMEGRIVLNDVSLRNFLLTLENTYGVNIRVKHAAMMNCRITTSFNTSEKIGDILDNLKLIYGISSVIHQNEIMLDGNGCN